MAKGRLLITIVTSLSSTALAAAGLAGPAWAAAGQGGGKAFRDNSCRA